MSDTETSSAPTALPKGRVRELLRFSDLGTTPLFERFGIPDSVTDHLAASVFGMTDATYAEARAEFGLDLDSKADILMRDPAFAAQVAELPFIDGDRIVILGDSVSADLLSWARLLPRVLQRGGHSGVTVFDRALSGRTTAEGIGAFDLVTKYVPTWILIALGGNDMRRHGTTAGIRMASPDETLRNLAALMDMSRLEAHARPVLITPWRLDPSTVETNRAAGQFWEPDDAPILVDGILGLDPEAIDLYHALDPTPGYWLADGVHPAEETHVGLLKAVVAGLAALPRETPRP